MEEEEVHVAEEVADHEKVAEKEDEEVDRENEEETSPGESKII